MIRNQTTRQTENVLRAVRDLRESDETVQNRTVIVTIHEIAARRSAFGTDILTCFRFDSHSSPVSALPTNDARFRVRRIRSAQRLLVRLGLGRTATTSREKKCVDTFDVAAGRCTRII